MSCSTDSSQSCEPCPPVKPKTTGSVGNTLFVDAVFGNDKTAKPFDSNHPYLTVAAAIRDAFKFTDDNVIRISIRPGVYNEGRLYPGDNMSIEGSGRLATQINGSFDTQYVTKQMTVLELTINSQDEPAIYGKGLGRSSFRRVKLSANYSGLQDGQFGVLAVTGNHIVTDSEVELNSTGGSNIFLHQHTGAALTLERNTNSLNVSPLPQVQVATSPYTPTRGKVEYVLNTAVTFNLPYIRNPAETAPIITNRFQITQASGTGPSKIVNKFYYGKNILAGQTYEVTNFSGIIRTSNIRIPIPDPPATTVYALRLISDTGEVSGTRVEPSPLSTGLAIYNSLGATQFIVLPGQDATLPELTNSNIQVYLQGGSGTIELPETNSDSYAYTFVGVPVTEGAYRLHVPAGIKTPTGTKKVLVINSQLVSVTFNDGSYFANVSPVPLKVRTPVVTGPPSNTDVVQVGPDPAPIFLPPLSNKSLAFNLTAGSGVFLLNPVINLTTNVFTFYGPATGSYSVQAPRPATILVNGKLVSSFGPLDQIQSIGTTQTGGGPVYYSINGVVNTPPDLQLRTLNNRSVISSDIPVSDVDNTRTTQSALLSQPGTNNVGETHNLTQPDFQLLVGQTPAITGNGVKAFRLQGTVNFTIGPSVVLAVRLLVPQSSLGSTAFVIKPDLFAVSDQGNKQAFTFPKAGVYTIDNALDQHVWIHKYFGNDTNLLHIFDTTKGSGPKASFNNTTLETGNTVQGLIKSNSTTARPHVNSVTVFETDYIPAIDVPVEAKKLTSVQQVSTAGEHLRGGSQIEEIDYVPAGITYNVPVNSRNLVLQGANTIILPQITTNPTVLAGVLPGTTISLNQGVGATQDSNIVGPGFVVNTQFVGFLTYPVTAPQWLLTATVLPTNQFAWLVSNPISQ